MSISIQVKDKSYHSVSGFSGWSGQDGSNVSGFSGVSGGIGPAGSSVSGWSGASGQVGTSGHSGQVGPAGSSISGFSGQSGIGFSGPAGISGWSGFSGPSASVYTWTTRAYKQLDEEKTYVLRYNYPPPADPYPIPTADSELNLALEANTTYTIKGVIITEAWMWYDGQSPNPAPTTNIDLETMWSYTGTINNVAITFTESGGALYPSPANVWGTVNENYPGPLHTINDWMIFVGGAVSWNISQLILIDGTIETNTSGVLSFCWVPYINYEKPPYLNPPYPLPAGYDLKGYLKRGSYLNAETRGGAASGCSGFSGKTSPVMLGSFLGI